jgi:hypothetical protein
LYISKKNTMIVAKKIRDVVTEKAISVDYNKIIDE